jgi:hypothetical protein
MGFNFKHYVITKTNEIFRKKQDSQKKKKAEKKKS